MLSEAGQEVTCHVDIATAPLEEVIEPNVEMQAHPTALSAYMSPARPSAFACPKSTPVRKESKPPLSPFAGGAKSARDHQLPQLDLGGPASLTKPKTVARAFAASSSVTYAAARETTPPPLSRKRPLCPRVSMATCPPPVRRRTHIARPQHPTVNLIGPLISALRSGADNPEGLFLASVHCLMADAELNRSALKVTCSTNVC